MSVSAPYNFVPISEHVCKAGDVGLAIPPSQDVPEPSALSGRITFKVTSSGPILVNWGIERDNGIKTFGLTPDDNPAIPGSTLRGAVRNVLEIATFGKMILADDARTSVRDLTPHARLDYGSRVSTRRPSGAFQPLSQSGWLQMVGGQLRLTPCEFARVEHSELSKLSPDFRETVRENYDSYVTNKTPDNWNMAWAQNVEAHFLSKATELDTSLYVQDGASDHEHGLIKKTDPAKGHKYLHYRKATVDPAADMTSKPGKLVFTGMPSKDKHMEFFFFDKKKGYSVVPQAVWAGFVDVHERQEKISETWRWRREQLYDGQPIPVFFLTDDGGRLTQLGLALMFKLPADNSIGQMIEHTSKDHRCSDVTDLAERIFGKLESGKGRGDGWRGRISFGWAEAKEGWVEPKDQDKTVILAKPKPGFPATYVRQRDFSSGKWRLGSLQENNWPVEAQYRSYMNHPHGTNPWKEEIRGWKRYPVGPERGLNNTTASGESTSTLRPIRRKPGEDIVFIFTLRYHNLQPVELGAVLWAMTWGGNANLRHAIGMGRPFGWGQVAFSADFNAEQTDALAAFVAKMEEWANSKSIEGGWVGSVQLRQLIAMADPAIGANSCVLLKQMILDPDRDNEFKTAKESGCVLPEYSGNAGPVGGDKSTAKIPQRGGAPVVPMLLSGLITHKEVFRFKKGDPVSIETNTLRTFGLATRDTDASGNTVIQFYASKGDEKKKLVSQDTFAPGTLKPLELKSE